MKILVIAAHPDDEVLGCGATIAKHVKEGDQVYICIVSEGASAQYDDPEMIEVRKKAAQNAAKTMGVKDVFFHGLPDTKLDNVPSLEINKILEKHIREIKPEIVYTHAKEDNHIDHSIIFSSTKVAVRPIKCGFIKKVLAYEVLGSTTNEFIPNYFVDVENFFDVKKKAFEFYKSEMGDFPHPRSFKALETLAKYRGINSAFKKAEAFKLIYQRCNK
ncbi:PIG-L family deacetylase [Candidatus Woesearchaeota archaeon]|nr:PIG-L family deacetylase [Candidatus Woesearchaeota archaeon]